MPDGGDRFMSLQVIEEDQYVPAIYYEAGSHTFTRNEIGTRYVGIAVRTLADPNSPEDIKQAIALQDEFVVKQAGPGRFEVPNWHPASQKKVRDALLSLTSTLPDTRNSFGARGQVDPVRHLIQAAAAWGGNPDKDALYLSVTPPKNDGSTLAMHPQPLPAPHSQLHSPAPQLAIVPLPFFAPQIHTLTPSIGWNVSSATCRSF
jgi:hypothetical protein